jgi:3-deoxy-D-manno-octulosonic-acid transferase
MILLLYNVALLVGLLVSAPFWLWKMATTRKYREGLWERLGLVPRFKGRTGRPMMWGKCWR